MTALLTDNLPLLAGAPNGIKKLRELILELAVRGKLVPQDPNDEPAIELLKRIAEEKARLVAEGKIKKQKPLPAIAEEEILFELPASWVWGRLGELTLKITDGTHHSPINTPSGDYKYISAKNIKSWGVDLTDVTYVTKETHQEIFSRCDPSKGDILYIKDGATTGIATINPLDEPFSMLSSVALLKPSCGLHNEYMLKSMVSPVFYREMRAGMTGVAITRVTLAKLNNAVIPLPPLAEQHRIVAKVDELMALCDRLEARQTDADSAHAQLVQALLDSLTQARDVEDFAQSWQRLSDHFHTLFTTESSIDALKQTLLQLAVMGKLVPQDPTDEPASELLKQVTEEKGRLVATRKSKKQSTREEAEEGEATFVLPIGWAISSVAQTGEIKLGRQRSPKDHFGEHMTPYLRVANVKENSLDLSDVKEMNFTPAEQEVFRLLPGDVLLNEGQSKELVGRPAIFNGEIPNACFQNTLLRFRAYDCVSPTYALRYFQACMHGGRFQQAAQQTTNIAHLSASRLAAIEFPLPPLPEQHRIVAKVDQLMALCDQLKARLDQACQVHEQLATALVEQAVA
ncbi:hypothetical protein NS201_10780 [Pseudomonas oryzihabitans]|nr:hypothetical protein NS201_10780 [Pseudomonas psychrotolerans]